MPSSPGHWVWRPNEGGGLLIGTACHTIDLLAYLIDSEPERVYAEGRLFDPEGKGGAGYYDALVGTILWRNGALSTVISGDQGQNRVVSKWFHEVWDGQRSAVLSAHLRRADFDGCDLDHVDTEEWPEPERRKAERAYPILANLLEVIRAGGETLCTVRDGVRAVAICEALGGAARTGRPQSVPL
jgi:predicted dehydrogenase